MTSPTQQVQALLEQIETVLRKDNPRLPWMLSGELLEQRQVLEQTRADLLALQQQLTQPSLTPAPPEFGAESAQQVLQAVLQEVEYLRLNLLQPLRSEVEELQRQRQQLQAGSGLAAADLDQIVDRVVAELQGVVTQQIRQAIAELAGSPPRSSVSGGNVSPALTAGAPAGALTAGVDAQIIDLDQSMRQVLTGLQADLETYQTSMSQGLGRMHSMGQQGEILFSTLVNHLAAQVGRGASTYLAPLAANRGDEAAMPTWETIPTAMPEIQPPPAPFTAAGMTAEELDTNFLDVVTPMAADEPPNRDDEGGIAPAASAFDLAIDPDLAAEVAPSPPAAEAASWAAPEVDETTALALDLPELATAGSPPAPEPPVDTLETALFDPIAPAPDSVPPAIVPPPAVDDIYQDLGVFYQSLLGQLAPEDSPPAALPSDADEPPIVPDDFFTVPPDGAADPAAEADQRDQPAETLSDEGGTAGELDKVAAIAPAESTDLEIDDLETEIDQALAAAEQVMADYGQQALGIEADAPIAQPTISPTAPAEIAAAEAADQPPVLEPEVTLVPADEAEDLLGTDPLEPQASPLATSLPVGEADWQAQLAADLSELEAQPPAAIAATVPLTAAADSALDAALPDEAEGDEAEGAAGETQEDETQEDETQVNDAQEHEAQASEVQGNETQASETPESEAGGAAPVQMADGAELAAEYASDRYDTPAVPTDAALTPTPNPPVDDLLSDLAAPTDSSGDRNPASQAANLLHRLFAPPPRPVAPTVEREANPAAAPLDPAAIDRGDRDDTRLDPPPPASLEATASQHRWYLGIDIGATGLSAILFNQTTQTQHPICWLDPLGADARRSQRWFRLPTQVYWLGAATPLPETGAIALPMTKSASLAKTIAEAGVTIARLKPWFRFGIPFQVAADPAETNPMMQWSADQQIPLADLSEGLTQLLATLTDIAPRPDTDSFGCQVMGLEPEVAQTALRSLTGAIVSYPANCPDTYVFNVREAVLAAGLMTDPARIFFVEEGIAATLSALPRPSSQQTVRVEPGQGSAADARLTAGQTVVISSGAYSTEVSLLEVPNTVTELTFDDFTLRSIPYAGDALDQDIVCQLLYPLGQTAIAAPPQLSAGESQTTDETPWDWSLGYDGTPEDAWQQLGLVADTLPQVGEPDTPRREQLRRQLQSTLLGQSLLEAAQHLKKQIQNQPEFVVSLGDRTWRITRKAFETQILIPYIQLLNRHLNAMLSKTGLSTQGIRQIICTGGSGSFALMGRWLRQKFPNAKVVQDTYAADQLPTCSRIAYGLVNLPLYPHVLHQTRQQYSDFFLLLELLRDFPTQPLPVNRLMQRLERRGVNTQVCYLHIMALLEGHLPPGLLPTQSTSSPLQVTAASQAQIADLKQQPLFHKQEGQVYIPNPAQRDRLEAYLQQLFAQKHQTLDEPFFVPVELAP